MPAIVALHANRAAAESKVNKGPGRHLLPLAATGVTLSGKLSPPAPHLRRGFPAPRWTGALLRELLRASRSCTGPPVQTADCQVGIRSAHGGFYCLQCTRGKVTLAG